MWPALPRRLPRVLLAAAVLLLATVGWAAAPAAAATRDVTVRNTADGAFAPASVTVRPGDTVAWTWTANEAHTIDFEDPAYADDECLTVLGLRCEGHTHEVRFDEAGTFAYRDGITGSAGTVVVEAAPTPSPTPSPSPTTSPSPTPSKPSPTPSPSPEPTSPSPTPAPTPTAPSPSPSSPLPPPPSPSPSTPSSSPPAPPPPPPPPPSTRTVDPQGAEVVGTPTEQPTASDPQVAPSASEGTDVPVPEPTFDDFPEAEEVDDVVSGGVAIDPPDDGGGTRRVWVAVGGLAVLGTLGAVGRSLLVADVPG